MNSTPLSSNNLYFSQSSLPLTLIIVQNASKPISSMNERLLQQRKHQYFIETHSVIKELMNRVNNSPTNRNDVRWIVVTHNPPKTLTHFIEFMKEFSLEV
jgi:hypothetical protein